MAKQRGTPIVIQSADYLDRMAEIHINLDISSAVFPVTSITWTRDPGCQWAHALIANTISIPIPAGSGTISQAQLNAVGIVNLADIPVFTLTV